jgi:hypothetical protein
MRRLLFAVTVVLVVTVALAVGPFRAQTHALDRRLLHERLMDGVAQLLGEENWTKADKLRQPQDYAWLDAESHPIRIAHALGDSGLASANSLAALASSHRKGFRVFEVDISVVSGALRCRHDPAQESVALPDECRFDTLLKALPADSWLVLDIKSDFVEAGNLIVQVLQRTGQARQVIFQLYLPDQVALFNRWQTMLPLAGPIVTAYLAHRRIDSVAQNAERIGARVLTLPIERLEALEHRPPGLELFLHPVHDCKTFRMAQTAGAQGVYTLETLPCAEAKSR